MHEYHVVEDIMKAAKKKGRPKSITLEVGALSSVSANEIKNALSEFVNWDIIVTTKKGIAACDCGFKGEPKIKQRMHDFVLMECPKCKNNDMKIIEGDKIKLVSVLVR